MAYNPYNNNSNNAIPIPVATAYYDNKISSSLSLPQGQPSPELTDRAIKTLQDQGYTTGLAKSLVENRIAFPLRIWIIDNSGSMQKPDGHRIVETTSKTSVKTVPCTRWEEIRECVNYHVQMAALIEAPTTFRFLNAPGGGIATQEFSIAQSGVAYIQQDVMNASSIMTKARPGGVTPLTQHMMDIHRDVTSMAPQLTAEGKRVVIVIATDGLPTDEQGHGGEYIKQQFVQSLRTLEGLPIWVVIRLCTDEEDVVNFYNDLDEQLELSIEVLDDFMGEAEEIYECNPWLNYALPLHRLREWGYHDRVFDMLDERKLTKSELWDFCKLLFGMENFDGVPDPSVEWKGFLKSVDGLLKREKMQWNPMRKKLTPWIDLKKLHKMYGDGSACTIM
uniref:VWFA domain-containing protein n=1 Tax=Ditylum brightwellii TaxID=49249 RepID=A0A7S4VIL9_9STRA